MLFLGFNGLDAVVGCEPSIDGRRGLARGLDLAERYAQRGAAEPVVRQRKGRRPVARPDAVKDLALHIQEFCFAEPPEQFLERCVAVRSKRLAVAQSIARRMRRIKVRARHKACWNELRRGVAALEAQ